MIYLDAATGPRGGVAQTLLDVWAEREGLDLDVVSAMLVLEARGDGPFPGERPGCEVRGRRDPWLDAFVDIRGALGRGRGTGGSR